MRAVRGSSRLNGLAALFRRPRPTHAQASRDNIYHHYDIGNDFYRLWLDREHLAYTCAYFARPEMSIEEAQTAKFEHVCRKVRLSPEMVVVEAGCGWGGLAIYMAKRHGVRVRAYNISREQIAFARERARREGLEDRVEFIEDDWRNAKGPCDAFVSVGMLEHVGRKNYRELGRVIDRCLTDHGRGLIHTIGQNQSLPFSPWIERRIFPGAYAPTLGEMMEIFAPQDFSVLDVENLRLHYAETLRHWLKRFDDHQDEVRRMFDETFIRSWRMYLAGSIAAFEASYYQLFQVVFNRANCNDVTMTREQLYDCLPRPSAASREASNSQTNGHAAEY
jgi:cyclopropane-fatty-acyl-phospholipid synthase